MLRNNKLFYTSANLIYQLVEKTQLCHIVITTFPQQHFAISLIVEITFSLALPACLDTSFAIFDAPPLLSAMVKALSTTVLFLFDENEQEHEKEKSKFDSNFSSSVATD